MGQKYQKKNNQKPRHILENHAVRRTVAISLLLAFLLQGISVMPIEKFYGKIPLAVSVRASELLVDRDAVELYDNASGDIIVEPGMADFTFQPEEDGAWMLDMNAYGKDLAYTYQIILYEWEYANQWKRIDYFHGPGVGYQDDSHNHYESLASQYYQKDHRYRFRFIVSEYEEWGNPVQFHYTFQKTEFAGCDYGWIWRLDIGISGAINCTQCVRYLGKETVVQVPDEIAGHPIEQLGENNCSVSNENIQVLCVGKNVKRIHSLSGCKNLKDIYVYNKDCYLMNDVCPQVYDEEASLWYYDTVIHGYAGGNLERGCRKGGYPFEALQESVTPSPNQPEISATPAPTESVAAPMPTESEAPIPTESVTAPAPMESEAAPIPTESEAAPTPMESVAASTPIESEAVPIPTESVAASTPIESEAAPTPTESVAAPTPMESEATPIPTESAAAPLPTESMTAPVPVQTATPFPRQTGVTNISTPLPTQNSMQPPIPSELPMSTANSEALPAASPVSLADKITVTLSLPGLKASTDHYTVVTLTWKPVPGASYQVYRSTSRSSGYRQIKKGLTKTRYRDNSVISGKSYYYRVQAVKTEGKRTLVQAESQTKRIKIYALARPLVQIQKKQTNGIIYLLIRVKKYQGRQIEIYYRNVQWPSYRKIKLSKNSIRKQKGIFRIQCMSGNKKLYLRVRTYEKKRGKKIYSSYTAAKKIVV